MQVWFDLFAVGVDRNKIDRQSNDLLLELWRELRLDQQFTKFGKHPQQEIWAVRLEDYMVPEDVPFDDALFCFEEGSDQGVFLKSPDKDRRPPVELVCQSNGPG